MAIEVDGQPCQVVEFLHVKPGKGSAFVRTKLRNYVTGTSKDHTFRAGEPLTAADVDRSDQQYSYPEVRMRASAYAHAHTHTHTHVYAHMRMHTRAPAHTHAHMHIHTRTCAPATRALGDSHTDAHTRTRKRAHARAQGDTYVFMNMETFDETRLPTDSLGSAVDYLIEGMDVSVLTWNGKVIGVDLPNTVQLEIAETEPGVKVCVWREKERQEWACSRVRACAGELKHTYTHACSRSDAYITHTRTPDTQTGQLGDRRREGRHAGHRQAAARAALPQRGRRRRGGHARRQVPQAHQLVSGSAGGAQ